MGLRWLSSFHTGIPVMDDDHKILINGFKLLRLVLMDRAPLASGVLLRVLTNLLHEHFRREEVLIARTAFKAFDSHQIIHGKSAESLERLQAAVRDGHYAAALDALGQLECWMVGEIVEADLSFASFVEYYNQGQFLPELPRLSSARMIAGRDV